MENIKPLENFVYVMPYPGHLKRRVEFTHIPELSYIEQESLILLNTSKRAK